MTNAIATPEWVHHAVFYQIFPDRFAFSTQVPKPNNLECWNSTPTLHGFKGGDLLGVAERLDYLQDLGINAIYFTPIFTSASNHRYHTNDYFHIDPILGGDKAFSTLLSEAHRRNIKVVLDGVFNHTGRGFYQFNHILECGPDSPYVDWFDIRSYPLNAYEREANYRCWFNLPALPELNHKNPQVISFLHDVTRYWLDQGIDGWRLDVPFCFGDDPFWQTFRQVVKSANPQAYIVGEIPYNASQWLQGDQFDAVMNYLFSYACWGFFGGKALDKTSIGHWIFHCSDLLSPQAEEFSRQVTGLLTRYPHPIALAQMNLLDSHDTTRILTIFGRDKRRLRLATLFQMTYPGAPMVYYGNEIGLDGGPDPDCRKSFPWDERIWDHELRRFFQKVIALRHAHRCLRDGDFKILLAVDEVCIFLRQYAGESAIVALNLSNATLNLDLDVTRLLADGSVLRNKLNTGEATVQNGHLTGFALAPMNGAILI